MKKSRTILSIIMALIMVISIIPMSTITASAALSGTCGDNLTWAFDESTGTLTISGAGAMDDYSSDNRPWEEYEYEIETVIVSKGITTIGDYAFSWCDSLTSVSIGNSVTTIGDYAFGECWNLSNVNIPNGVTTIGDNAFSYTNISSVTIPESVTSIGSQAFLWCNALPGITVDVNNQYYSSDEYGVLFNKDKTVLVECSNGSAMTSYTIPDSVIIIADYAFQNCCSLTSVTIGNSVITIGGAAFDMCDGLRSITIPDSVTTIDVCAFSGCGNLTSVTIGDGVTTIGERTFDYCWNLTTVTIPDSVTTIGDGAFKYCSIENVYYGGTEKQWNEIVVGRENDVLLDATIYYLANGSNLIGKCGDNLTWAFDESTGTLTISGTGDMYDYDLPWNTYQEHIKKVVIGDGVTTIGGCAFDNCANLESVKIGAEVETIKWCAFQYCYKLKDVILPDSLISIESWAFAECDSITSITIPDSVITIGDYAFENCDILTSMAIGKSVTTIENYTFSNCDSLTSVIIPDSVTTIGDSAFSECENLTDIIIPDSVTTIGYFSFYACYNLANVTLGDNVTTIGCFAFYGCPFVSITIPDSVVIIDDYAFYNCTNITDVYYCGTEEQWGLITIGVNNEHLTNATIHFNYTPPFTGVKDDYFYINDVKQKAYQLVEFEGDFYFINDYNKIAKNKRIYLSQRFVDGFTYEDGTPLAVGYYDFDENGKMIIRNGVVGDYFYKNNVRLNAYQLVEYEGNFYFINDSHKVAKNKRIYLSQRFVDGFTYEDGTPLAVGYYEFDENGKMKMLNGPVGDYFYENNIRLNAYQLVEYEGNYYFINDYHKLAKNKRLYMSQRFVEGTDLAVGYYEFDADGKMIIE